LDHVYKQHRLPKAIISDRDPVFTSNLWLDLFRLTDTMLLMSLAYHPQTDGQTERLNQYLEGFLRCTVHSYPRQWSKWLSVAEFWYNTAYHSGLRRSPFEVLYGHNPRHLGMEKLQLSSVPDLETWMKERELLSRIIQQQLERAQQIRISLNKPLQQVTWCIRSCNHMCKLQLLHAPTRSFRSDSMGLSEYSRGLVKWPINWNCHRAVRSIQFYMCHS
jgi:hypothetical protein